MEYYIGVDLGGTNIKVGVVDEDGAILAESDCPTALPRSAEAVCDDILTAAAQSLQKAGLSLAQMGGIGVGCPGTANGESGIVEYSNNLGWRDFDMRGYIESRTGLSMSLGNDANVAALGEVCAGSAKGAQSAVIVTLGTGVGTGVVIGSKLLTGYNSAASELGHAVIQRGGRRCTCGRYGCLEAYASATGLILTTSEAVKVHPDSLLAAIAREQGSVDGRTAFTAMKQGDAAGKAVVNEYIDALACGVANIVNIFQPEIVSLGGGIAKEGEGLLAPLREKVYAEVFGGRGAKYTRIECCTLGYKAGIIGAAMLAKQTVRAAN